MDPVMPIGSPWHYIYFHGQGRDLLAETLGAADPFSLPGSEIVERVLAAGFTPDLEHARRTQFPTAKNVSMVERDGQSFIVSIDTGAETIAVQEERADAYGPD